MITDYTFLPGDYRARIKSELTEADSSRVYEEYSNIYNFTKESNGSYFIDKIWKDTPMRLTKNDIWKPISDNNIYRVSSAVREISIWKYDKQKDVWIDISLHCIDGNGTSSSVPYYGVDFTTADFWNDGQNDYFSYYNNNQYSSYYGYNRHYKIDISSNGITFTRIYWNIPQMQGHFIWNDDDGHTYYSNSEAQQYILDKSTNTWTEYYQCTPLMPILLPNGALGRDIWTDGDDIYYSAPVGTNSYTDTRDHFKINNNIWIRLLWRNYYPSYGRYVWHKQNNTYYSKISYGTGYNYYYNKSYNTWISTTWSGLTKIDGSDIWTDGDNIYYSHYNDSDGHYQSEQYILNGTTWEEKHWSGSMWPRAGAYVWTDGNNIYYSVGTTHSMLDKNSNTWIEKQWFGPANDFSFYGNNIWTDGDNIYYSANNKHYILNKNTDTWTEKTWYGLTEFNGIDVWTYNNNVYYLNLNQQYILDKNSNTWIETNWNMAYEMTASAVWKDSNNIYSGLSYYLDKNSNLWIPKTWNGNVPSSSPEAIIWKDGRNNVYYSYTYYYGDTNKYYKLDRNTDSWIEGIWSMSISYPSYIWVDSYNRTCYSWFNQYGPYILNYDTNEWEITDEHMSAIYYVYGTSEIWVDGDNVYYSSSYNGTKKLNKNTSMWCNFQWNSDGLTYIEGSYIWTDGDNIYYSSNEENTTLHIVKGNYVLDRNTNTWNPKTWYGLTEFHGGYVWTDGDNIYYSYRTTHYILNKNTDTWTTKDWGGLDFYSSNVWYDKNNVYLSPGGSQHYILDKENQQWVPIQMNGLASFSGTQVWNSQQHTYYSYSNNQYVFNSNTNTWVRKQWDGGKRPIYGQFIWTDGTYVYHSGAMTDRDYSRMQYVLIQKEEKET